MLDKLKVVMFVGLLLQIVRNFLPSIEIPEGFQAAVETLINSLYVIIPVALAWFKRESKEQIANLVTK